MPLALPQDQAVSVTVNPPVRLLVGQPHNNASALLPSPVLLHMPRPHGPCILQVPLHQVLLPPRQLLLPARVHCAVSRANQEFPPSPVLVTALQASAQ